MYNPRFKWRDDEAFPDDDGVCPDFAGIAERLSEMQKLETRGWWGETSFDPEQEEVMRTVKDTLKGVRVALAGDALHLVDARPLIGTCRAPLLKELLHAHLGRDYEDAGVVHVDLHVGRAVRRSACRWWAWRGGCARQPPQL